MRTSLIFISLAAASGCGTQVYRASGASGLDLAPAAESDDDDSRAALRAAPQLASPARVAVFSFDADRADAVVGALDALDGVEATYLIPPMLVTGQRRYQAADLYARVELQPLSVKKLRLLAARAGCDLLIISDYGWRQQTAANGLAAFNALLLPALFTPFLKVNLDSYLDSYVVDVRNGYLYGQVSARQRSERRFATVYALEDEGAIDAMFTDLLTETGQEINDLLTAGGPSR